MVAQSFSIVPRAMRNSKVRGPRIVRYGGINPVDLQTREKR
jgi:hypothetical protein